MKLTLKQIVEASPALARLGSEKLPVKMAYTIGRNIQKLKPELENFDKTRDDLIKNRYGVKNDDGNFEIPTKNREKFVDEINVLQALEVEIDIWVVKLSELEALQDAKSGKDRDKEIVTSLEMAVLDFMFEYDLSPNGHKSDAATTKRKRSK
jgi:hypothetical protein